ncbi:MAG: transketolase [Clostridiales bacterium]|jgi:transketolase|nr:transketolase [Clostridiales bacterium]
MPNSNTNLSQISAKARRLIVDMVYHAKSGHPGGSLGIADIMTYLYFEELQNLDVNNPKSPMRDRFVLSKGHCAPALYAALALKGFFPIEDLPRLRKIDSHLQGHPCIEHTPGVDASTGSLGQGISIAAGMAKAAKVQGSDYRVYSVLGDGECQEGQVWEAFMFAAHYKLDNLCAVIDINGLQIDGEVANVMGVEPIASKLAAFNWNVIQIDGHNYDEIKNAFNTARACIGKPSVIIAKTIKGKGVKMFENKAEWHGKAPNDEQYSEIIKSLGGEA